MSSSRLHSPDSHDSFTTVRTFTQRDYDEFAEISGDDNPIHVDPEFCAGTRWGRTLCHGMLLCSVVSGLIGRELPGPGTEILEHELKFPGPTYTGEPMTIRLELLRDPEDPARGEIISLITRPNGEHAFEGRAKVRLPS